MATLPLPYEYSNFSPSDHHHQSSPLETLLSERIFNSNPSYLEDRLGRENTYPEDRPSSHLSYMEDRPGDRHPYLEDRLGRESAYLEDRMGRSGTESDRSERRGSRPKRRRKYVTYPATFRLEVCVWVTLFGYLVGLIVSLVLNVDLFVMFYSNILFCIINLKIELRLK